MSLVQLFVLILVIGLVYYFVRKLPIPSPFKELLDIIAILIVIVCLLSWAGLLPRSCGNLRVVQLNTTGAADELASRTDPARDRVGAA